MFWLEMPVLVATNTAGDVLTSCQKCQMFDTTNVAGDVLICHQRYLFFCHQKHSWKLS